MKVWIKPYLPIIIICFTAFCFRLYRISDFTEFLGDQGRTGIIIHQAAINRSLPLIGPTVLTGQHLGPFFYYFIGIPFVLFGFHPLAPAVWMVLLGVLSVFCMYWLGSRLFGVPIGTAVAAVYAISPKIVAQDRVIWEPNMIPLFVLLYFICMYRILADGAVWVFLFLGLTTGILVQLHYPNGIYIFLSFFLALYVLCRSKKPTELLRSGFWQSLGFCAFIIVLLPFLLYEFSHEFQDIREIVLIFFSEKTSSVSWHTIGYSIFDFSSRLMNLFFAIHSPWQMAALQIAMGLFLLISSNGFSRLLFCWYLVGIFLISLYRGVVFDHYLGFLLPLPFLFLGRIFEICSRIGGIAFFVVVFFLIVFTNSSKLDIFSEGHHDIDRVHAMTKYIIDDADGNVFSFALASSRSFSDLHYRYFFLRNGIVPKKITEPFYSTLYIVCDEFPCPSKYQMRRFSQIQAICYDPHCSGEYPKISLQFWRMTDTKNVSGGRLYRYVKKTK